MAWILNLIVLPEQSIHSLPAMPQDPQATKLGHHIISCSWNSALVKPPFSSIFVGQLSIFPSEVSRFVASIPTSGLFLAYFWVWISTVCWWSPVDQPELCLPCGPPECGRPHATMPWLATAAKTQSVASTCCTCLRQRPQGRTGVILTHWKWTGMRYSGDFLSWISWNCMG